MVNEFVPYKEATALCKLGFDEPCFGYYDGNHNLQYMFKGIPEDFTSRKMGPADSVWVGWYSAPLIQQAFKWFEGLGLFTTINCTNTKSKVLGIRKIITNDRIATEEP
jgi:hypothetical protein